MHNFEKHFYIEMICMDGNQLLFKKKVNYVDGNQLV